MDQPHHQAHDSSIATAIAGALDWWRDAGVDLDFSDAPQSWLPQPERDSSARPGPAASPAPEPAPPPPPIGGNPDALPDTLAAFHAWWLSEPSLDAGPIRERVPARGAQGAALMVIVAQPEAEDGAALLSGREGRLLAGFLAAAEMDPDAIYLASVLPRHMVLPDWDDLARRGLGRILAHHIRLAAPQRLLVFGNGILSLVGHDPAQNAQPLSKFAHEGGSIPLFAARELGALLARPAWKAGFWRSWLDWTGTTTL